MVGSYGDRNGAKVPMRIMASNAVAATIAARCFRKRDQISWCHEAVKYFSFFRR